MHLLPSALDVRTFATRRHGARLEDAVARAFDERDRLRVERNRLNDEQFQLAAENNRLLEENAALRDAAAIWIRLYERQLERANRAHAELAACTERGTK
jgi:hypothetical protein